MSTEAVNSKEPWLTFFDKEYFCCEKGTVEHDVASILKNMLLSTDVNNAAHTAAYQLNTYYWERNNESGPFFQWGNEKEPFPDFISFLYDIIVRVTPFLSYNDASQNVIVQLVLELRNLPPNSVKAWNVCVNHFSVCLPRSNMMTRVIVLCLLMRHYLLSFWTKPGLQPLVNFILLYLSQV